jgi:predicted DNA-binding transcriptional regulator YafY
MSYQAKIKRYLKILQLIEKSKYPTVEEMIARMGESGLKVSDRQIKRDIESLRGEFGLDIHYSAGKKGYYIDNEDLTFPYFLKLLEFSQNIELLTSYLKEGSDISEIIEFEEYHSFKGLGFIHDIAFYIKNGSEVNLRYKRFDTEIEKDYSFQPYLLREYLKRWYVIGLLSGTNKIRTFGLDRIVCLQESNKKFIKLKRNNIATLFKNVIGITASEIDQPVDIELVCKSYQGKLLKTLPLHKSQRIVSESTTEIILGYKMVVNFELKQRLLMISTQAKVVKPENLKLEMEKMLTEAQNYYNNEPSGNQEMKK